MNLFRTAVCLNGIFHHEHETDAMFHLHISPAAYERCYMCGTQEHIEKSLLQKDVKYRLCGLVISVLGYRSGGQVSIPDTTRKKSSGSGTGSTQPRHYN
jgi:hypothetical protein